MGYTCPCCRHKCPTSHKDGYFPPCPNCGAGFYEQLACATQQLEELEEREANNGRQSH